eukprot:g7627.t1
MLSVLYGVLGRTIVLPGTLYYDSVPSFERDPFNYIVAIGGESTFVQLYHNLPLVPEIDVGKTKEVLMTSSEGIKYSCGVPIRTEDNQIDETDNEEVNLNPVVTKSPFDILDTLGSSCLFRIEQYWSFEFCYKKRFRQFHEDKDERNKLDYTLGIFDPEIEQDKDIQEDVIRGRKRNYVRQLYTNGDVCDQTEEPRTTEVRFFCDEQSQWSASAITGIEEGPTCHYVVSVSSPLLCKHPEFKTEETTRVIVCDRLETDEGDQEAETDVHEKDLEETEEVCESDGDVRIVEQSLKDEL